jgi:tRNA dimethylallyltransferase
MTALLGQYGAHADEAVLPYNLLQVSLVPTDRAWLHDRINRRFGAMVREGLLDELHALRRQYDLHADLPSMRCVGYRQAWSYLEGDLDMAGLLAQGAAATRQLAKRQLTWLRGWQGAHEVDCMDAPQMEGVLEMVRAHLGR